MAITEVVVNYMSRNYFNDYDETRSERMTWVEPEKVSSAIDKLVRRYRNSKECDCMFVKNDDGTGWRLIKQTTYWGEEADTEELMRFYRHCDGYPEGHGMDMAEAIKNADRMEGMRGSEWLANFLGWFLIHSPYTPHIEFEPKGCQHGDLEYLYVVEGIVDHRWGKTKSGKLPITISVYNIGWDESYADVEKREPIFSGTAYEYIERFGKEQ